MFKRKYNEDHYNDYNKKPRYDIIEEEINNNDLTDIKLQIKELILNIAYLQRIIQKQNTLLNNILNYNNPVFEEPASYIS
jgi:hypothetical protein